MTVTKAGPSALRLTPLWSRRLSNHVPQPLVDQLKRGGRLVIPVGGTSMSQNLMVIEKDERGKAHNRAIIPVRFVPLTGEGEGGPPAPLAARFARRTFSAPHRARPASAFTNLPHVIGVKPEKMSLWSWNSGQPQVSGPRLQPRPGESRSGAFSRDGADRRAMDRIRRTTADVGYGE